MGLASAPDYVQSLPKMTADVSTSRAIAGRVAKWLVDKERPDEAVRLLCAWAVAGPNDSEGQQLLAEALRIDPSARAAQMAFERMEGIAGDHQELMALVDQYSVAELNRLEAEMKRPSFRRAQMGFNNNIRFREQVFHVQTEDSGLDQPHIITHLFADGGRVIKSHKRSYLDQVKKSNVAEYVRALMKAQHLEMVAMLREGRFDGILDGREIGGLDTLLDAPNVDIRKLASQKKERAEARAQAHVSVSMKATVPPAQTPSAVPAPKVSPLAPPPVIAPSNAPKPSQPTKLFNLHVLRSLTDGPDCYSPTGHRAIIGRSGEVSLPGEHFAHPEEAALIFDQGALWLEDLEGGNGVFLRIRTPVELSFGDEFVVGDQLLRVEANPHADDGPDPDPTYFYSSPKWPSSFRIVQVFEGGASGACLVARGNTLQVGSAVGDLIFPDDPLVGEQHCVIEEQAGTVLLSDLGSRTGVFVRIRGSQELLHGDELLVGRTRLVVDLGQ
jgi:pSer/pThr/pTyr-binding forkhead associated (FHA) protein